MIFHLRKLRLIKWFVFFLQKQFFTAKLLYCVLCRRRRRWWFVGRRLQRVSRRSRRIRGTSGRIRDIQRKTVRSCQSNSWEKLFLIALLQTHGPCSSAHNCGKSAAVEHRNTIKIAMSPVFLYWEEELSKPLLMQARNQVGAVGEKPPPYKNFPPWKNVLSKVNLLGIVLKIWAPQKTFRHRWCPKLFTGLC